MNENSKSNQQNYVFKINKKKLFKNKKLPTENLSTFHLSTLSSEIESIKNQNRKDGDFLVRQSRLKGCLTVSFWKQNDNEIKDRSSRFCLLENKKDQIKWVDVMNTDAMKSCEEEGYTIVENPEKINTTRSNEEFLNTINKIKNFKNQIFPNNEEKSSQYSNYFKEF